MPLRKFAGAFLCLCCLVWPSVLRAQLKTETYCNGRFGYCIGYPPALLKPQPEAYNGDGRSFKDARGIERLSVYGMGDWNFSADGETPAPIDTVYRQELQGGRFPDAKAHRVVTYKALGKTSFVISGTEKGEIFYLKVIKKDDAFCFAYLHYPADLAKQYNPIAALIAKTFG